MTRAMALKDLGEGRFELAGDLVFENAAHVLEEGDAAFRAQPRVDVDLVRVGRVDSAGLALLLEWAVAAREAGRVVSYRNLSSGVSALAGISDVSELLDASASAG